MATGTPARSAKKSGIAAFLLVSAVLMPLLAEAHERFLFTGQKTCIDCHKGIAHKLPDMKGVEGWQ